MTKTDQELVQDTRKGERGAYVELIQRYSRLAYSCAYLTCRDMHEAEDISQDAFIKAHAKIGSLRDDSQFRPWLMTIVKNLSRDHHRRKARKPELVERDVPEPDHEAYQGEVRRRILDAVAELPENYREAVLLRYIEGWSTTRILEVTGLGEGALKSLLHRGLGKLRGRLQPLYNEIHEQGEIHDRT